MSDNREWTIWICSRCGLQDPADCGRDFDCEFSSGEEITVVPRSELERVKYELEQARGNAV